MAKTSTTGSPNSETGTEDNKSSSPFGVRLRKVVRATLTLILCHCSSTSVTSFKNESLAHYRTLDKKVKWFNFWRILNIFHSNCKDFQYLKEKTTFCGILFSPQNVGSGLLQTLLKILIFCFICCSAIWERPVCHEMEKKKTSGKILGALSCKNENNIHYELSLTVSCEWSQKKKKGFVK